MTRFRRWVEAFERSVWADVLGALSLFVLTYAGLWAAAVLS